MSLVLISDLNKALERYRELHIEIVKKAFWLGLPGKRPEFDCMVSEITSLSDYIRSAGVDIPKYEESYQEDVQKAREEALRERLVFPCNHIKVTIVEYKGPEKLDTVKEVTSPSGSKVYVMGADDE